MPLTYEQTERACGFLVLNEFNVFIYCCKSCKNEFVTGSELESHILLEHQVHGAKTGIETVFVLGGILESVEPSIEIDQKLMKIEDIKYEIEVEPAVLQELTHDNNDESTSSHETHQDETVKATRSNQMNDEKPTRKKRSTITNALQLDPRKYYCDMCPFDKVKFTRKKEIYRHLRNHVAIRKQCPICNETTSNLSNHLKTQHRNIDPYKCKFCERNCHNQTSLEKHIRTHTGERPYLCSTCGSAFKTSNALKVHIDRLHNSGKVLPYSCGMCNLQFRMVSQFEQHRLTTHRDERPHICDVCGDCFKTTQAVREHKFKHGEKTFPCRYCGKMFRTTSTKRFHERKVHEEVNWKKKKMDRN